MAIDGVLSGLNAGQGLTLRPGVIRYAPVRPVDEAAAVTRRAYENERGDELKGAAPTEDALELSPAAQAYNELTEEEQARVDELAARDREVRQHEQAHMAAAGGYARGGARYEYETGPDGQRYAVGGEVSIDTSEVAGDPEATIAKMKVVKAAALAPAEPSSADYAVAADADAKLRAAQSELNEQDVAAHNEQVGRSDYASSAEPAPHHASDSEPGATHDPALGAPATTPPAPFHEPPAADYDFRGRPTANVGGAGPREHVAALSAAPSAAPPPARFDLYA